MNVIPETLQYIFNTDDYDDDEEQNNCGFEEEEDIQFKDTDENELNDSNFLYIFFDFETTGLIPTEDDIIQASFQFVLVTNKSEETVLLQKYTTYVYTEKYISKKITNLTGIDNELLNNCQNKVNIKEMLIHLFEIINELSFLYCFQRCFWIAYNGFQFDYLFLCKKIWEEMPLLFEQHLLKKTKTLRWFHMCIDPLALIRKLGGRFTNIETMITKEPIVPSFSNIKSKRLKEMYYFIQSYEIQNNIQRKYHWYQPNTDLLWHTAEADTLAMIYIFFSKDIFMYRLTEMKSFESFIYRTKMVSVKDINLNYCPWTKEQNAIIQTSKTKNLCILAGAGCAKTATIVARILYLIRYQNVDPRTIYIMTFSKTAADDIERKIQQCCKGRLPIFVGTIDKLAKMIILKYDEELHTKATSVKEYKQLLIHFLSRKHCEIRKFFTSTVSQLLIDEAQDLNDEYMCIILLFYQYGSIITFVGDDNQNIYGFNHSTSKYLLEFENYFTNSSIQLLTKNFRSTPEIVHAANVLIAHNKYRFNKTVEAVRPSLQLNLSQKQHFCNRPQFYCFHYEEDHDDFIIKTIRTFISEFSKTPLNTSHSSIHSSYSSYSYSDVVILCRISTHLEKLQERLIVKGIPCRTTLGKNQSIPQMSTTESSLECNNNLHLLLFDNVTELMTMHRSKGLERILTFVIEMNDDLVPSFHLKDSSDEIEYLKKLEDERRVFYTAITRPENFLFLLSCCHLTKEIKSENQSKPYLNHFKISRFIYEMNDTIDYHGPILNEYIMTEKNIQAQKKKYFGNKDRVTKSRKKVFDLHDVTILFNETELAKLQMIQEYERFQKKNGKKLIEAFSLYSPLTLPSIAIENNLSVHMKNMLILSVFSFLGSNHFTQFIDLVGNIPFTSEEYNVYSECLYVRIVQTLMIPQLLKYVQKQKEQCTNYKLLTFMIYLMILRNNEKVFIENTNDYHPCKKRKNKKDELHDLFDHFLNISRQFLFLHDEKKHDEKKHDEKKHDEKKHNQTKETIENHSMIVEFYYLYYNKNVTGFVAKLKILESHVLPLFTLLEKIIISAVELKCYSFDECRPILNAPEIIRSGYDQKALLLQNSSFYEYYQQKNLKVMEMNKFFVAFKRIVNVSHSEKIEHFSDYLHDLFLVSIMNCHNTHKTNLSHQHQINEQHISLFDSNLKPLFVHYFDTIKRRFYKFFLDEFSDFSHEHIQCNYYEYFYPNRQNSEIDYIFTSNNFHCSIEMYHHESFMIKFEQELQKPMKCYVPCYIPNHHSLLFIETSNAGNNDKDKFFSNDYLLNISLTVSALRTKQYQIDYVYLYFVFNGMIKKIDFTKFPIEDSNTFFAYFCQLFHEKDLNDLDINDFTTLQAFYSGNYNSSKSETVNCDDFNTVINVNDITINNQLMTTVKAQYQQHINKIHVTTIN